MNQPDDTVLLFLPLAHSSAGSRSQVGGASPGGRRAGRRRGTRARGDRETAADGPARGDARVREDARERARRDRARRREAEPDRALRARRRRAGEPPRARGSRTEPPSHCSRDWPTGSSSPRCARGSAAGSAWASPGPRRSRPTSMEFFHSLGVPVIEGYGLTETGGLGDRQRARRLPDRHRRPAGRGAAEIQLADDGEILIRSAFRLRRLLQGPRGDVRRR